MADRSAIRNRSPRVTVSTPRGAVHVVRQQIKGTFRNSRWEWLWMARRAGKQDWCHATTAVEAIRRATLMPPRDRAGWLRQAAAEAERQILAEPGGGDPGARPAVDEQMERYQGD